MKNTIKLIIGSYGSYNACNERALGSNWLDLADFEEWEDIEAELKKQGFDLDGIDEELFIQDIEGIDISIDYLHPKKLFDIIKKSDVLNDDYAFKCMEAIIEAWSFYDFEELVEKYEEDFIHDIDFYQGERLVDIAYMFAEEMDLPEFAQRYFDYEAFARDLGFDGYIEVSGGVIRRY